MEAVSVAVSKLNNNNWNVWRFQMKVILMAKGVYSITSGEEKKPDDGADNLQKWLLGDAKAQEALVTRMEEGHMTKVICDAM